jgi:hypothetical protein
LEHAYNNSINATTSQVPFELLYGKKPLEFKDLLLPSPTTTVESVNAFVSRMESLVVDASKSIAQANRSAESQANRKRNDHAFGMGDKVLLSTNHFTPPAYKCRKRKLASKFAGPYEVVQVVSPVAVNCRYHRVQRRIRCSTRPCCVLMFLIKPVNARLLHQNQ